jgi:putative spermidine/putrescine transport system ATP-binding protein
VTTQTAVALEGITKRFGAVTAVDDISLSIAAGEFFTLLGPSGSGKTTTLRMIAGFDQPTAGRVLLHGEDVTELPPFDRDANTVFQDYALFPHMSVRDNVAYGLKVRGTSKAERRTAAEEALEQVRLGGYGDRKPAQLSGGQRQRVALARALVLRPGVLLLDEPLGALDQQLREEMQLELKSLQRNVGITFVLVTHDQSEALAMSDRIAIFDEGRIVQIGTPREIYDQPSTRFVADFVGSANILSGALAEQLLGHAGTCTVRAEHIALGRGDGIELEGTVREVAFMGASTRILVDLPGGETMIVDRPSTDAAEPLRLGDRTALVIDRSHIRELHTAQTPQGENQ